ncbi:MAG: thioredoxin family protein [Bacteroidota bacterium]
MSAVLATTHFDPQTRGTDRSADWAQGQTFEDFLPTAEKNAGLWSSTWERTHIPDDLQARADALLGDWKLLVLSADWCGDASNTVPVLARLAEQTDGLDLRLLERDDHLDLMDEHLTGGTARAIPVVLLLDASGGERAWWGPRPVDLQAWVKSEGMEMETDARYREVRKWYARDKGRTTLHEVLAMIEAATGGQHVS